MLHTGALFPKIQVIWVVMMLCQLINVAVLKDCSCFMFKVRKSSEIFHSFWFCKIYMLWKPNLGHVIKGKWFALFSGHLNSRERARSFLERWTLEPAWYTACPIPGQPNYFWVYQIMTDIFCCSHISMDHCFIQPLLPLAVALTQCWTSALLASRMKQSYNLW